LRNSGKNAEITVTENTEFAQSYIAQATTARRDGLGGSVMV
jgi:hypothetical protein